MRYLQDTAACLDQLFDIFDLLCEQEKDHDGDAEPFMASLQERLRTWRMMVHCVMADDELHLSRRFAAEAEHAARKAVAEERDMCAIAQAMARQQAEKGPATDEDEKGEDGQEGDTRVRRGSVLRT